mgnify:CR=1 FL=1
MSSKWNTGKKVFEFLTPKIKKNLKDRRKTFETMTGAVDKQYEKAGIKITPEGQKIKKEAVIKGSKIHDKYEKLQKILDKSK